MRFRVLILQVVVFCYESVQRLCQVFLPIRTKPQHSNKATVAVTRINADVRNRTQIFAKRLSLFRIHRFPFQIEL